MIGRPIVFKLILCGILVFGVGLVALNLISHNRRQNDFDSIEKIEQHLVPLPATPIKTKADFESDTKPAKLTLANNKIDISKVPIRKYKISLDNKKQKNILVREAGDGNNHVLLLHGQKSSSLIWKKIGTLQYLSTWGYRVFAIDIPNSSNSSLPVTGDQAAVQWLTKLIRALHLSNLVIISPSMSGRLTLPYVLQLNEQQQLVRGYVPIAPAGANIYSADQYERIQIPTLIVHGDQDIKYQAAFDLLQNIPKSEVLLIKGASHASYYDRPMVFHNRLRQFLYNVYRPMDEKSVKVLNTKSPLSNATKVKKHPKKSVEQ